MSKGMRRLRGAPAGEYQGSRCQENRGCFGEGGEVFLEEPDGFVHGGKGTERGDIDVAVLQQGRQAPSPL